MKNLIVLISLLFLSVSFLNCTTFPKDIKTPNIIRAVELKSVEIVYSYPLSPWNALCFAKVRGTFVAAVVVINSMEIVRFCYLDQGKLVAFEIDIELYKRTGTASYMVQDMPENTVEYMTGLLNRANMGLDPIYEEENEGHLKEV